MRLAILVFCVGCYQSHVRTDGARDAQVAVDAGIARDAQVALDAGTARDATRDVAPEAARSIEVGVDVEVVSQALDGLRWELPCADSSSDRICSVVDTRDEIFFGGSPSQQFEVTLRFRGVVETARYSGGTREGMFQRGGSHGGTDWNLYALDVEEPLQTFYLNAGADGEYFCVPLDYQRTIRIDGGARLVLRATVRDGQQIRNRDRVGNAIRIVDVPPYPAAFDGQFIQVDVVSVRELP